MDGLTVIEDVPARRGDVCALIARAFGKQSTAQFVDHLFREGRVVFSMLAVQGERLLGHIVFVDIPLVMDERPVNAVLLACLAVEPDTQRQGVGRHLVQECLKRLQQRGINAVLVDGVPRYYPSFGFSAGLAKKIRVPGIAGPGFMALELASGALSGTAGCASFPPCYFEY
jgi:putative acetyltransferase